MSTKHPDRTWFITGASKGFGQHLVSEVISRGEKVVATFRNLDQAEAMGKEHPDIAQGVYLDVTQPESICTAIQQALVFLGKIDVVVNNAGYGQFGAMEDLTDLQIRAVMETNFFGVLNVTRAVLPHLRERRSGRIINISSLAGFTAFVPGASVYAASKFAVEGLSEGLALEVAPLGIGITLVEPGSFRTEFGGSSMDKTESESADYHALLAPMREYLESSYQGNEPGDPAKAAKVLVDALNSPEVPDRLVLGADAVAGVRNKLAVVERQVAQWENVSRATGF